MKLPSLTYHSQAYWEGLVFHIYSYIPLQGILNVHETMTTYVMCDRHDDMFDTM